MSNKHRDHIERRYNSLMDALRSVIDYNEDDDFLDKFICDLKLYGENYFAACSEYANNSNTAAWILWQLLVLMYGDYGVSPRAGWIDDLSGALHFLEELKRR